MTICCRWLCVLTAFVFASCGASAQSLNDELASVLLQNGFTGNIESTLEARMGRPVNQSLSELGRQLFFDPIHALHDDNSCAGCHDPASGFADSQSISIGVQSNMQVGLNRTGPRNSRRAPTIVNSVFYPKMMWDGRFSSPSGDPFDNSQGFKFPQPEGRTKFKPNDPVVTFLAIAQAHMPPVELKEQAGYTGTRGTLDSRFDQFDDGLGDAVPLPNRDGYRNERIRAAVQGRMNTSQNYRDKFGDIFPEVKAGAPITFLMVAQAIGEWETTMVRANAPLDRFARGNVNAMTDEQKRGALLFFGKANCVSCHAVSGQSNEMFSDFKMHNIGVPQIAPSFGVNQGNVIFDGPGENEDFGLADVNGDAADRYKFRTAPLRNLILQPTFFHNGSFTKLSTAVKHHLDVVNSARQYTPADHRVARDLRNNTGPIDPVLATLDRRVQNPIQLTTTEVHELVTFVREGLLDPDASTALFCAKVPTLLPSRMKPMTFQGCQ
jgi:cytochrome c peroxidase